MKKRQTKLLKNRQALVKRLSELQATILRGSLIKRYKRCGKAGCKCADGRGHGPKYYLSVSHPGSLPEMDYVPQEYQKQVAGYLKNFQLVRKHLEQICKINQKLLRRRENF